MKLINYSTTIILLFVGFTVMAQDKTIEDKPKEKDKVQFNFNESGSHYLRLNGLIQVWLRHTELNPGSTIGGYSTPSTNDIGLRRLRFQVYGQLTDRIFFYSQFGQNNFSPISPKYTGAFFHDALAEYKISSDKLSLGAGLTAWSGLLRYASPSVGSILSLDAPLYQQATNGINDQFLRKLSVYAKGQLGKLDYRLALTTPMDVSPAATIDSVHSNFSGKPAALQTQAYFKYQFFENESNLLPYNVGTYLGQKKILALGAGFISQPKAMWKLDTKGDTLEQNMQLIGVDVFFEAPINESKSMALTFYGAFSSYNFGDNYIRNVGVMNPANGSNANARFNGSGNAFPMGGTGNILYVQSGLIFGNNFIAKNGKIQPFIAGQIADFEAFSDKMVMTEVGLNWYINGTQASKISLNYQDRPIFEANTAGEYKVTKHKGMAQLQLQVTF
jgi:hypothetical protein